MIFDSLKNAPRYYKVHPGFEKAFDFLQLNDLFNLPDGKHIIDGDSVFALVNRYEPKDANELELEGHRKYIDIQVLVEGSEKFGHALLSHQPVSKPYDELKDIAFFKGEPVFGILEPGNFYILFPHDLHMPGVKVGHPTPVKKIVIKVAI